MNKRPIAWLALLIAGHGAVPAGHAAASDAAPVRAVWKRYALDDGRYRGYNCAHAEQAARDILESASARAVRTRCYWNSGLAADWESLSPVPTAAAPAPRPGQRGLNRPLGELLSKTGGGSAPTEPDQSSSTPPPVPQGSSVELDAVWMRAQIQRHMSGGWACNAYSDIYDAVLARIPTRNVQYTVFCDQGSGYIQLAFDYLAPQEAPPRPPTHDPRAAGTAALPGKAPPSPVAPAAR